jgi:hypothetical protein
MPKGKINKVVQFEDITWDPVGIFDSITAAAIALGVPKQGISRAILTNTHYDGYRWLTLTQWKRFRKALGLK